MIDVALYASGNRVLTATAAQGVVFSHDRRGPQAMTAFFPGSLAESFRLRNMLGLLEMVTTVDGGDIWRGRVEDRTIGRRGILLTAYGYSRAFADLPYTALWSVTGTAGWRPVTDDDLAGRKPKQYEIDNNNRLFIALKKNEQYGNMSDVGELTYAGPHGGERGIVAFSASYAMVLPANWQLRIIRCDDDFGNAAVIQTLTGNGSEQSGTISQTFTGQARLLVQLLNNTGSAYTNTADTGDFYARLTGIRLKSTTAASVVASDIAGALYDFVAGVNGGQMAGKLITATQTDLGYELYEDEKPEAILEALASREGHDWGVDANGLLYFGPRGAYGRTWYVDAADIQLEESLNELTNSVYATYREAGGSTRRTNVGSDSLSAQIHGVTRRDFVAARTTSEGEAETWRDARLADGTAYALRATVVIDRIIDTSGGVRQGYEILPGDQLVIRNLLQTLATDIDILSSISVARVEYEVDSGVVAIEPDTPTPTLVTLVARKAK